MQIASLQIGLCAIVLGTTALASAAVAQATPSPAAAPPVITVGAMIRTAAGQPVGHIDDIQTRGGTPVSVGVIVDQREIHIPAATLSASPKGLVTSLTRKDFAKLP